MLCDLASTIFTSVRVIPEMLEKHWRFQPERHMQHILIVDDEPGITYLFARIFRLHGYRITEASCGAVALEVNRLDPVDGVITDFVMPGMNGLQLLNRLQEKRPALPGIIVSSTPHDVGAIGPYLKVVGKPCNADTLVRMMQTMFDDPARLKETELHPGE
jgi:CheY-like chemotaxis protein